MSGTSPYWIASDGYAATVATYPPTAVDLPFSNDLNLHDIASLSKRPQAYVANNQNSTHPNVPHSFDIAVVGKERAQTGSSFICTRQVPITQHVPPRHLQNHSMPCNGSASSKDELTDKSLDNDLVSSPTAHSEVEISSETVNHRKDIELTDKQLKAISAKELNRRLKQRGITKSRQKEIKSEKRTIKNRGSISIKLFPSILRKFYVLHTLINSIIKWRCEIIFKVTLERIGNVRMTKIRQMK